MSRPLDYSRWGHIDVSDDEDNQHPNIDKESLWRWEKQARYERYAKQEKEKEDVKKQVQKKKALLIEAKTEKKEDKDAIQKAEKEYEEFKKKEQEIERRERLHPNWNSSNMCKDGFNKSSVNPKALKDDKDKTEDEIQEEQERFFKLHRESIRKFGMLKTRDASQEYLKEHPEIFVEYTANYLVVWCVDLQVDDKDEEVRVVAQQCILIQHMLEVLKTKKHSPMEVIQNFFERTSLAGGDYNDAYNSEVEALIVRVQTRAKERVQEAIEAHEMEEKEKRMTESPGGLDPQEVYESLPKEMQECFDSRDIYKLQEVAQNMDYEQFKYHYERCVKSGLWCPGPDESDDDNDKAAVEEEGGEEK